ncbi:hypothetical protein [Spirosoma koreense]
MAISNRKSSWTDLVDALRSMKIAVGQQPPARFEPDVLGTVTDVARNRLNPDQYRVVRRAIDLCNKALARSKKGDLAMARQLFDEVETYIPALSGEARALVEVTYHSEIAYFHHRSRNPTAAEACIARTLVLDDELQGVYYAFHGHKIHTLHNKSRALLFQGEYEAAADQMLAILRYLLDPTQRPYATGDWGAACLERYDTVQRVPICFEFTFFDFVYDGLRSPRFDTVLTNRSTKLVETLRQVTEVSPIYATALDWLTTKQLLYGAETAAPYIRATAQFLRDQPLRYDFLKMALLMDAARVAQLVQKPAYEKIVRQFIDDYYNIALVAPNHELV